MDTAAILAKIAGIVLLLFTGRSVYGHFKNKLAKSKSAAGQEKNGQDAQNKTGGKHEQSKVEHALNTALLYAWFVFMTAFSVGMIVNN